MEWLRKIRHRLPGLFALMEEFWSVALLFSCRARRLRKQLQKQPPPLYRIATVADAPLLADLCATGLAPGETYHFQPHPLTEEGFRRALAQRQTIAVIERADPPASYGFLRLSWRTAWIGYLVHQSRRKKGEGRKIAQAIAQAGRSAGYRVCATIHKENRGSIRAAQPFRVIKDLKERIEVELLSTPEEGQ